MSFRVCVSLTATIGALVVYSSARAIDITECGQIVPSGEVGVLQNDLDCELVPVPPKRCWSDDLRICETVADCKHGNCTEFLYGVFVGDRVSRGRAGLDMNGHSIDMGGRTSSGIGCRANRCTVVGPGEVFAAAGGACIDVDGKAEISDVEAHDCGDGIYAHTRRGRVTATNVTVHDNTGHGIQAFKLKATNVTALDNGEFGISARRIKATGVVADGNRVGVGDHVESYPKGLRGRITGLEASDNTSVGVQAESIKLIDSTLSSNGAAETGADIRTNKRPRLKNTTCSRSEVCERDKESGELVCTAPAETWGVCGP